MRNAHLKTILTQQKQSILQQLDEEIRKGRENELDEGLDTYDLASDERDQEISLLLGDRDRDKLRAIDEALERIEEGEYGLCEQCEEEIGQGGLETLPFTRLCVACQEQVERESRFQRVDDSRAPRRSTAVDLDDGA